MCLPPTINDCHILDIPQLKEEAKNETIKSVSLPTIEPGQKILLDENGHPCTWAQPSDKNRTTRQRERGKH
jgi:hypothetical protein